MLRVGAASTLLVHCKAEACGKHLSQAPNPAVSSALSLAQSQADAAQNEAGAPTEASFPGMHTLRRKFDLAQTEVRLRDVHMSRDFAELLESEHAELVINGGFFGTQDEPLGFAMSDGRVLSPLRPSLTGGVLLVDHDRATQVASEDFTNPMHPAGFGIQCRPRLVVRSHVNVRSDDGKRAERTALCISDQGRSLEVAIVRGPTIGDGPSLLDLARYLQSTGCEEALALDGGPSSGYAQRRQPEPRALDSAHAGEASATQAYTGRPPFTSPRGAVRHVVVFRSK
jgi:uncharacterized protein YigE (DUF2233 family)